MSITSESHTAELNGHADDGALGEYLTDIDKLDAHELLVHRLIHRECEAHPEAEAIDAWDGSLTYRGLDDKSSRLANLLLQYGVGPDVIVPLCFDKSMWTAVAILAVMKAGGGFMLLDPGLPLKRLKSICLAVKASHVLHSLDRTELATGLELSGATITVNEASVAAIPLSDDKCPNVSVTPASACYVVFTSGSTGNPKGIIMSHLSIARSICKIKSPMHLRRGSRVMQFGSYAFDLSVYDHLFTLAAGACLCVPSEESRLSALSDAFIGFRADWVTLTPSVARILDPTRLSELKVLALAGEAITHADVEKWLPHAHISLLGLYGPAEFAGAATIRDLRSSPDDPANIGRSYNATCWVIDPEDHTKPLPPGQEGELVLEGPCLSHGYVGTTQPGSAAFSNSAPWLPGSRSTNARLYYTGDIVLLNPDGTLQFLGRKDTQVKLSGQRIELQEVEYHLQKLLPEAGGVIVEPVPVLAQGTRSLVAFVNFPPTWNSDLCLEDHKEAEFRAVTAKAQECLTTRLPQFMVPRKFLCLRRIPMTRTGKTDRKALRSEAQELFRTQSSTLLPHGSRHNEVSTSPEAETLRLLCEKTLGLRLENLPSDVGWLQLGGDSLLAMKLVDQARCQGISITAFDVLTVVSLAQLTSKLKRQTLHPKAPGYAPLSLLHDVIETRERMISSALEQCQVGSNALEDLYPCTALQVISIPYMVDNRSNPTLRLRCLLPEGLDKGRLIRAWYYIVSSNPMLRTRLVKFGERSYYQAVVRDPVPLDLTGDVRKATAGPVPNLFGFGKPLVSASLYDEVFVMSMHHLLLDGYSFSMIFRDLNRAYQGESLPVLSFGPFMRWESSLDEHNIRFWKASFAGFSGKHFPPVPSPEYTPIETMRLQRKLPIRSQDGFTSSNRLRLAIAVAFARNLGTDRIIYGDMLARRAAPIAGISEMALPTASILPICVHLKMDEPLSKNLERVQSEALGRLDFEGIGKDQLRQLSREAKAACDYQTVVIIQPEGTDRFHGIFEQAETEYGQALGLWSLCLECWLTPTSFEVKARIDENVLTKARASRFLQCLETVFDSIIETPLVTPADLEADFDF